MKRNKILVALLIALVAALSLTIYAQMSPRPYRDGKTRNGKFSPVVKRFRCTPTVIGFVEARLNDANQKATRDRFRFSSRREKI